MIQTIPPMEAHRSVPLRGAGNSAGVVIGDLSSSDETHKVAEQVNAIGRMDAVIHNAGVYRVEGRSTTLDGHARTLAVNTLAPYVLTALIAHPSRLIYLSSGCIAMLRPCFATSIGWSGAGITPRPIVKASSTSQRSHSQSLGCGQMSSAMPWIPVGCQPKWVAPEHRTILNWDLSRKLGLPSASMQPCKSVENTGITVDPRRPPLRRLILVLRISL